MTGGAGELSGGVFIPASGGAGIPDLGASTPPELTINSTKEELGGTPRARTSEAALRFDDQGLDPEHEVHDLDQALKLIGSRLSKVVFGDNWIPACRGAKVRHFRAAMNEAEEVPDRRSTREIFNRVGEIKTAELRGQHA
jgi:hypothetical protein